MRIVEMRYLAILLAFCAALMGAQLAAEETEGLSEDLLVLFESGSNQYRLGSKMVSRKIDLEKVTSLTSSSDDEVADLAEIVKSKVELDEQITKGMLEIQQQARNAAGAMQLQMMGFMFDEIFSDGDSTYENAGRVMNNMTGPVGSVVDAQADLFKLGTEQVINEATLREKFKETLGFSASSEGADRLFSYRVRLDRDTKEHAAISVQNKSGRSLPESLILIEIDYEFSDDAGKTLENALGTGFMVAAGVEPENAILLGLSYQIRDRKQQEFHDLDKGASAFLRNWKQGEYVELRLDTVLPFLLYTKSIQISVLSKELQLVDAPFNLTVGKKELWKLYESELKRRRAAAERMRRKRFSGRGF